MPAIPSAALEHLPPAGHFIGGTRIEASQAVAFEHIYPGSGESVGTLPIGGREEVDRAVAAARAALPGWMRMPPNERRSLLLRVAAQLRDCAEELADITVIDNGSPLTAARGAPFATADAFEYFAGWADKLEGAVIPVWPGDALDYTRVEPYGVVGFIIPFNGPIMSIGIRLAPALAAGNTVVLKPSELAPYGPLRFAELCTAAGIPAGVVNILCGDGGTGRELVRHPGVDKLHFTGSVTTAQKVLAEAAVNITPVALELGGKSANIVFEDADLDAAAEMAVRASVVAMSGQTCICPSRLLIQDSIYADFIERVVARAKAIPVGDPFEPGTAMGPVISAAACERIEGVIERARNERAGKLLAGGERLAGELKDGFFLPPTVFGEVDNRSNLAQEEIFGPVLAAVRFSDEADALALANDTPYGLAGYVHTRDLVRGHVFADALEAGYVSINGWCPMPPGAPFGGNGRSGVGRLGGRAAMREFLREKNVYVSLARDHTP